MSLLVPDSGLLFWMILSFGVVFVILTKYGFPVVLKLVNDRKAYIDQALHVAKEANAQLDNLKKEGELIITKAHEEQLRILNEAVTTREKIVREAKERAEIESSKILDEVKKQIEAEKLDAFREVRRQISSLSVDIAEKVLRKNLENEKEQTAMIDRLLDEITASKN